MMYTWLSFWDFSVNTGAVQKQQFQFHFFNFTLDWETNLVTNFEVQSNRPWNDISKYTSYTLTPNYDTSLIRCKDRLVWGCSFSFLSIIAHYTPSHHHFQYNQTPLTSPRRQSNINSSEQSSRLPCARSKRTTDWSPSLATGTTMSTSCIPQVFCKHRQLIRRPSFYLANGLVLQTILVSSMGKNSCKSHSSTCLSNLKS